jgi:glyoxylase I family protein
MSGQNGEVIIEGDYATLKYHRRLAHPREVVWKAITDPKELAMWFNNKAVIDGGNGGTIDFVFAPAGFHTTGRILVWDPPRVFEHEWHTAPHPQLPNGEAEAVIRWELVRDGDSSTLLTLTFSRLTKAAGLRFVSGMHAFLDRLMAQLDQRPLPDWEKTHEAAKRLYGLVLGLWGVRYQVKDVQRSIEFYTQTLGFTLDFQNLPAFGQVSIGNLKLILSGPGASGSRPMPDGSQQEPGGWNRVVLLVQELPALIADLKKQGVRFRNEMEVGPGGRQIQVEDPDGNPIELFEPARTA